jgi:co-chaperonin GroES (HSP10)
MENAPPTVSPYSTGMDVSGQTLEDLFPPVDPEFRPFGSRVLVQLRRIVAKTKSGIILAQNTKDTEAWNIQVARIIACGPLAFKRRDTAEAWPEGVWAKVGDFVKVPRWGGDRWSINMEDGGEPVSIVLCNDSDLIGAYTGDPLKIKAYLA